MNDTNKERAAFEARYASQPDVTTEPERSYELDEAGINELIKDCIWEGWKARAAKAPAAPTQAEFALRALVAAGFVTQAKVDEALTLPGAPPAAEPVAWRYQTPTGWHATTDPSAAMRVSAHHPVEPLYTAPPAPTEQWVSVGERLPEWVHRDDTPCHINGKEVPPTLTSKTVLVALDGGGVRTDKLTTIEGKSNGWWNTFGERVIAWQDAPAPPQGAAKGE